VLGRHIKFMIEGFEQQWNLPVAFDANNANNNIRSRLLKTGPDVFETYRAGHSI